MSINLVRAATTIALLAGGLQGAIATASPSPSLRVTIIESTESSVPATTPDSTSTQHTASLAADSQIKNENNQESHSSIPTPLQTTTESTKPTAYPVTTEVKTQWALKHGQFLREVLQTWSDKAGWSLVWHMPEKEDFRFDADIRFGGDFKEAIINLFNALPASIQIYAELRPDNIPPLLYITREQGIR